MRAWGSECVRAGARACVPADPFYLAHMRVVRLTPYVRSEGGCSRMKETSLVPSCSGPKDGENADFFLLRGKGRVCPCQHAAYE